MANVNCRADLNFEDRNCVLGRWSFHRKDLSFNERLCGECVCSWMDMEGVCWLLEECTAVCSKCMWRYAVCSKCSDAMVKKVMRHFALWKLFLTCSRGNSKAWNLGFCLLLQTTVVMWTMFSKPGKLFIKNNSSSLCKTWMQLSVSNSFSRGPWTYSW